MSCALLPADPWNSFQIRSQVGSAGSKDDAVLPGCDQMVKTQVEVVSLASRTSQIQELINLMKVDVNEPCNLTTHRDSRCLHVHQPAAVHSAYMSCMHVWCFCQYTRRFRRQQVCMYVVHWLHLCHLVAWWRPQPSSVSCGQWWPGKLHAALVVVTNQSSSQHCQVLHQLHTNTRECGSSPCFPSCMYTLLTDPERHVQELPQEWHPNLWDLPAGFEIISGCPPPTWRVSFSKSSISARLMCAALATRCT